MAMAVILFSCSSLDSIKGAFVTSCSLTSNGRQRMAKLFDSLIRDNCEIRKLQGYNESHQPTRHSSLASHGYEAALVPLLEIIWRRRKKKRKKQPKTRNETRKCSFNISCYGLTNYLSQKPTLSAGKCAHAIDKYPIPGTNWNISPILNPYIVGFGQTGAKCR